MKNDVTRYQHTNLADGLENLRNIIRKLEQKKPTESSPESIEKQRRRLEILTVRSFDLESNFFYHFTGMKMLPENG